MPRVIRGRCIVPGCWLVGWEGGHAGQRLLGVVLGRRLIMSPTLDSALERVLWQKSVKSRRRMGRRTGVPVITRDVTTSGYKRVTANHDRDIEVTRSRHPSNCQLSVDPLHNRRLARQTTSLSAQNGLTMVQMFLYIATLGISPHWHML